MGTNYLEIDCFVPTYIWECGSKRAPNLTRKQTSTKFRLNPDENPHGPRLLKRHLFFETKRSYWHPDVSFQGTPSFRKHFSGHVCATSIVERVSMEGDSHFHEENIFSFVDSWEEGCDWEAFGGSCERLHIGVLLHPVGAKWAGAARLIGRSRSAIKVSSGTRVVVANLVAGAMEADSLEVCTTGMEVYKSTTFSELHLLPSNLMQASRAKEVAGMLLGTYPLLPWK